MLLNVSCLTLSSGGGGASLSPSLMTPHRPKKWVTHKVSQSANRSSGHAVEVGEVCTPDFTKPSGQNIGGMVSTLDSIDKTFENESPAKCSGVTGLCSDGSYSFCELPAGGFCESEGRCGQTTAANIFASYCSEKIEPRRFIDTAWDMTPGTRPGTLVTMLNTVFDDRQCYNKSFKWAETNSNASNLISDLYRATESELTFTPLPPESDWLPRKKPVAVLVDIDVPHWVTVVGVVNYKQPGCSVVINENGRQHLTSCSQFVKDARLGNTKLGICSRIVCSSYTIIAPVSSSAI